MEPIKFISPSRFFYWEKCPMKFIYSNEIKGHKVFPKHPDIDLGIVIHSFYQNQKEWQIKSPIEFEKKWQIEINKIDEIYCNSDLQRIYYPIKWNAKYYAVKKFLLRLALLKEAKMPRTINQRKIIYEYWIDDGKDIGGRIDYIILNENEEIVEIGDIKTGNIFEIVNRKKTIKRAYTHQLILYSYIIKQKQKFYPKCFIQDLLGNKYEIEIMDELVFEVYNVAKALKSKINQTIISGGIEQLANPSRENCTYCEYRAVCTSYKNKGMNKFEKGSTDLFGLVIEIKSNNLIELKVRTENVIRTLKNIRSVDSIEVGDDIYVFNLFCPDDDSEILFAMKETIIKRKESIDFSSSFIL